MSRKTLARTRSIDRLNDRFQREKACLVDGGDRDNQQNDRRRRLFELTGSNSKERWIARLSGTYRSPRIPRRSLLALLLLLLHLGSKLFHRHDIFVILVGRRREP